MQLIELQTISSEVHHLGAHLREFSLLGSILALTSLAYLS